MAVPLMALGAIATLGFRSQSVDATAAALSEARVAQTVAINEATTAIAIERLARIGSSSDAEISEMQSTTDSKLAALEVLASTISADQLGATNSAVNQARATTEPWQAAQFYSEANSSLLAQNQGGAADIADADLLNSWIVSTLTSEAFEAREQAWVNYFAEELQITPNTASVVTSFALADRAQAQAIQLASGSDRSLLEAIRADESALAVRSLENQAVSDLRNGSFSVEPQEMTSALTNNRDSLSATLAQLDQDLTEAAADGTRSSTAQRQLYSLLGIIGAVVLGGLVFVIYRSITSPLTSLLDRADHIANVQLPALVKKLRTTSSAELLPDPPQIPTESSDEIGDLVHAFNRMQTTAHTLATEQAISRRNVSDMFINLGRRNQRLLQRMLGMVTELEQDEANPDTLESLFALDQLVTRMRRNAESLLVLAGTQAPRQWSKPISVENAVRGSIAEVEDYKRVEVAWLDPIFIQGSVVADVTHLLAELIENALAYSDPSLPVHINGEMGQGVYLLSVTDQGIGLDDDDIVENNLRISSPPPLDQAPTRRLGLFVVGRLAERHEIKVKLVPGARQGTVARIEIPQEILVLDSEANQPLQPAAAAEPRFEELEVAQEPPAAQPPVSQEPAAPVQVQPEPQIFDYTQHDFDEAPATSPLEQQHDIDSEFEELTSPPIQGWDTPVAAQPVQAFPAQQLPVRMPAQPVQAAPEQQLPVRMPAQRVAGKTLSNSPLPTRGGAPANQLPVRNPGGLVAPPTGAAPQPVGQPESTEAQASQFSSLMSAFSTGVSKGLQDSTDDQHPERRAQ